MENNAQKRPEPWYQPGKHVWTTDDVQMSEEHRRIIKAVEAEVARKGLERLRRSASEHERLPDPPVRERQDERDSD
jgi:hypothetical protein